MRLVIAAIALTMTARLEAGHVIDLQALRFETDGLVSVSPSGRRTYSMPDLHSFAPQLTARSDDYFIVQAKTSADQTSLRAWLEAEGIPILEFLPQTAYLVRASQQQLSLIEQRQEVFWAGHYSPAFRIDPRLDALIRSDPSQRIQIRALFDASRQKELPALLNRLRGIGLAELKHARRSRDWTVHAEGLAIRARDAALLPGCLWVERHVEPRTANNTARTSQNVATGRGALSGPIMDVEDVWARGIRGEGQIAGTADTGLSTGNLSTLHQDFGQLGAITNPMRVIAAFALGRPGNWSDDQSLPNGGHGTHTAGSLVGNGFRSGSIPSANSFPTSAYAGTAPKAGFVFQSVMDFMGSLGGIPANLNTLFQQAYDAGARVHSNSWGSDVNGEYTTHSQDVDEFTWRNQDMVITFCAGNSGDDTSSPGPVDGVINHDSIWSPATAKNSIAAGGAEGYMPSFVFERPQGDCTSNDGVEQRTWGWYPFFTTYGMNPIFADLMADNANGMAAFSSRGPTDDGRIKPDLVAPATAITSTRTDMNQGYAVHGGTCQIPEDLRPYYNTMNGTSMASPLTAGAATLVRQYYADGWHPNHSALTNASPAGAQGFSPSSALVKATLINGAWDMSPGQYGTGAAREIPAGWDAGMTLPNNVEGFGRVDVEKSLFPGSGFGDVANRALKVHDVKPGLMTGGSQDFTFNVTGNGNPLIVTLVWTDPPGATGAGTKLVNNLDLTVTAPGGGPTYYPNGVDKPSGADNLNNVEQVKVTSPTAGLWMITVAGTNVPGNAEAGSTTQPFALVISGESAPTSICTLPPSFAGLASVTAPGGATCTLSLSSAAASPSCSEAITYNVYRSTTTGFAPAPSNRIAIGVTATIYDDANVSSGTTYYYKVRAVENGIEETNTAERSGSPATPCSDCTPPGAPTGLTLSTPANNTVRLTWAAGAPAGTSYSVFRESGTCPASAPVLIANGIVATTYDDAGLAGGATYRYVVRAVAANGCQSANSACQSVTTTGAALAAPPSLVATGAGTTSMRITWGFVAGATSTVIERSADNVTFIAIATTAGNAVTDTVLDPNKSYMYRAVARDGGGNASSASRDAGTTMVFTDDPLVAGSTTVKAIHLTQLRAAVNAMRALAGLPAGSYTDPAIATGTTLVKAVHVTELRSNLDAARSTLSLPALAYTDPTITPGTTAIKAAHIEQLRDGAN